MLAHGEADRTGLQHLGPDPGQLEHFGEGDLVKLARFGDDARIGGVDAVDVGVDVAAVGLQPRRDGDRRRVGAAAPERGDAAVLADPLETGDDRDRARFQCFVEGGRFDRLDPGIAVDPGGAEQLPAHETARVEADRLEGHREEAGGDLLARGDDHVIFLIVMGHGGFAAQLNQPVGLPGHGGDHDQHLIAGLDLALDAAGDAADPLDPGHRGAAEFHHDAGHKRCGCSLG